MNIDLLIEKVTQEVMKRIKESMILENPKNSLLVLGKSNENESLVERLKSNNFDVHFIDDVKHDIKQYEALIVPSLNNKEIVDLALGMQNSNKESLIIDGLFKGKKIYALEEGIDYRNYASTANKVFFNTFKGYEDKIKSFGINVFNEETIINSLKNAVSSKEDGENLRMSYIKSLECDETKGKELSKNTEENKVQEDKEKTFRVIDFGNKKLISEVDIKNAYKQGANEIRVAKNSIVTPLAKDFARISKLQINKK